MHHTALGYVSSLGIALSYFACTLAQLNAGARVLYHLAQENMFVPSYGEAHPQKSHAAPRHRVALGDRHRDSGRDARDARLTDRRGELRHPTHLVRLHFVLLSGMPRAALLPAPQKYSESHRRAFRLREPCSSSASCSCSASCPSRTSRGRYLPYIFAATLVAGLLSSYYFYRRSQGANAKLI